MTIHLINASFNLVIKYISPVSKCGYFVFILSSLRIFFPFIFLEKGGGGRQRDITVREIHGLLPPLTHSNWASEQTCNQGMCP